jgi:hypothetical protein
MTRLGLVMLLVLVVSGLLVGVEVRSAPLRVGLPRSSEHAVAWYREHRGELVAVAQLARSGALGDPAGWEYYGPRLPKRYDHLSVNGRIAAILGPANEPPVLFLATVMGIPDDAIGVGHFVSPPTWGAQYDGFGMVITPTQSLGDGWWWME